MFDKCQQFMKRAFAERERLNAQRLMLNAELVIRLKVTRNNQFLTFSRYRIFNLSSRFALSIERSAFSRCQLAFPITVKKIDRQANSHPRKEPQPRFGRNFNQQV